MDPRISPVKFHSSGGVEPGELKAGTTGSCDHVIPVAFVSKPMFKTGHV